MKPVAAAIAVLAAGVLLIAPGTARPAFPGVNGKIAYVSDRDGQLHVYTVYEDGSGERQLTRGSAPDEHPAWSPDGTKIAFTRITGNNSDVWVMNADGSGQFNLTRSLDPFDGRPAWSPDGTKIAFVASVGTFGGSTAIFVMNADGTGKTQLSPDGSPRNPAWSPDGRQIAYDDTGGSAIDADIFVVNADGSGGLVNLTHNRGADVQPDWSPDSRRIYFVSNRLGSLDIYRMLRDGTGVFPVRNAGSDLGLKSPAVSPDGQWVAFDRTFEQAGTVVQDVDVMSIDGLIRGLPLGPKLADDAAEPDWQAGETDDPRISCDSPDGLWHGENVSIRCTAQDDGAGLLDGTDSSFFLLTSVPVGAEDANASTATHEVCDRVGNCITAGPIDGNKVDRAPPTLTLSPRLTVPATSPEGAVVLYLVSASDGAQPNPTLSCLPESGSVFPIGTTQVHCTAVDHVGNAASGSFDVEVAVVNNTPAGSNVFVQPLDLATGTTPVSITFANVTTGGDTSLTISSSGPVPPAGFDIQGVYYQLATTAAFDRAEVCFPYTSPPAPPTPTIVHWVGGVPQMEPTTRDTGTEVCAEVTSFSPFALVVPAAGPADTDAPTITCGSADGAWHGTNVSIGCTAQDSGSGLADPADAAFTLSTSVPAGSEDANAATGSRQVCDVAGNCATAGPAVGNKIDRKAPTLTLPASKTVDANSPAGAIVGFIATATDGADPNPAVSCSPASGAVFAIGTTTVACTATDHVGNASSGSFTITVLGAKEQLNRLIQKVVSATALPPALKTQLIARLQSLVATFDPTNAAQRQTVCTALRVFVAAVQLLSGHRITAAQAAEWIADANRIRAVLGC